MRLNRSALFQRVSMTPLVASMLALIATSFLAPSQDALAARTTHAVHTEIQNNIFAEPGSYKVKIEHGTRCTNSGTMQNYVMYVPQPVLGSKPGPFPTVLLIHGFMMTGEQHKNNAEFLAEHGFIVFTPDIAKLLWGDDKRTRNVGDLVDDLAWLTGKNGNQPDSVKGMVDSTRLGIAGNSSGGAAALELALAAQKANMPVRALVSLDGVPWDRTLEHLHELSPLKMLTLRAEPCLCNYHSRMVKFLSQLPFPYEDVKVNGARHCDVENPTTLGCFSVCGKSDDEHRQVFRTLLYLFLREELSAPKIGRTEKTFSDFVSELQSEKKVVMEMNYPEGHRHLLGSSFMGH